MKKIFSIVFTLLITISLSAQTNVILDVDHKSGDKTFAPTQTAKNDLGNDFNVSRLEYYISKISIIHDGGTETEAKDVYALVNPFKNSTTTSTEIPLGQFTTITNVEAIKFHIGVNPEVNNQDPTQWPAAHPLAPKMPSMHWGWTAGYRFVAMEGKGGTGVSNVYEFHALGNNYYYTIQIPTTAQDVFGQLRIQLNADYTEALGGIDVSAGKIAHGVENETIKLLQNFRDNVFTSSTGQKNILASVAKTVSPSALAVYPNPSTGTVSIDVTDKSLNITSLEITDITGKVIKTISATDWATATTITLNTKGVYLVNMLSDTQRLLTKKLIIQ